MSYKLINNEGNEEYIKSFKALAKKIKSNQINEETLFYDDEKAKWIKAADVEDYNLIKETIKNEGKADPAIKNDEIKAKKSKAKIFGWLLIISSFLAGIAIFNHLAAPGTSVAYYFGRCLGSVVPALIIWALFFRKKLGAVQIAIGIAFLITTLNMGTDLFRQKQEDENYKEFAGVFSSVLDDYAHERQIKQPDYSAIKDNFIKAVAKQIYNFLSATQEMESNYLAHADLIEGLLEPQNLVTLEKIEYSEAVLSDYKSFSEKYYEDSDRMRSALVQKLSNLPASNSKKGTFIRNFKIGMEKNIEKANKIKDIELQLISHFFDVLSFMKQRIGTVVHQDNQLYFQNDEDIKVYNQKMSNIFALVEEEERLLQEIQSGRLNVINEMKEHSDIK